MIDIGLSKMALIGAVALIVIGPEKLPRVARTVGTLIGKAQRYVSDVKAEVNRSMELDDLKKMKETMEGAARDVQSSMQTTASEFEKDWRDTTSELESLASDAGSHGADSWSSSGSTNSAYSTVVPTYKHPGKNFRTKRAAVPTWYKQRSGVRSHVLSGAARVARYRPKV